MIEELREMNMRMEALEKRSSTELNRVNRRLHDLEGRVDEGLQTIGRMDTKLTTIEEILTAWNNTKGFVNTLKFLNKGLAIIAVPVGIIVAVYFYGKTGHWKSPFNP